MLALASTLLLSFTAVLALDVPAEVNKADMVDFGGRVLRKSGWLSIIWWGSGYTWKATRSKDRNKENHRNLTTATLERVEAEVDYAIEYIIQLMKLLYICQAQLLQKLQLC